VKKVGFVCRTVGSNSVLSVVTALC